MSRHSVLASFVAVVGVVPTLLVVGATPASAFVTSSGSGSGSIQVGSLDAPTGVDVTPVGSDADVVWSPVPAPGVGTVGYVVTRTAVSDGTVVDVCGSPSGAAGPHPDVVHRRRRSGRHLHLFGDGALRLVDLHGDAQ